MEAKALKDFEATFDTELSLKKDSEFMVLSANEAKNDAREMLNMGGHWYKAQQEYERGLVSDYCVQLKDPKQWDYGTNTTREADELLKGQPVGAHLICEDHPGEFTLSVRMPRGEVKHNGIENMGREWYLTEQGYRFQQDRVTFSSLNKLVDHYRTSNTHCG